MGDEDKRRAEKYEDKYFDTKFEGINSSLATIIANQSEEKREREELRKRVDKVEKIQELCPICNIEKDFRSLESDLAFVRFFSKHPKLAGVTILGGFTLLILSIIMHS